MQGKANNVYSMNWIHITSCRVLIKIAVMRCVYQIYCIEIQLRQITFDENHTEHPVDMCNFDDEIIEKEGKI